MSFLWPVLYLLAMGVGLGHLVDGHLAVAGGYRRLGGVSYTDYVGPGVLVASAMQWGANESMYPVMGGLKWLKTYHAMLATPIETADIVRAHLAWVATRASVSASIFVGVLGVFGDVLSPLAVLAVPAAVLTAVAFAGLLTAFTATQSNDAGLTMIYRLGIVPLFLFSGTFFPISQLPGWLEVAARATPLYHAVSLSRAFVLGQSVGLDLAAHAAYLIVMALVGYMLALKAFRRRLVV
jgi:lipooligosaccharide transport system permease protein